MVSLSWREVLRSLAARGRATLPSALAASAAVVVGGRVWWNLGRSADLTQADEPAYLLAGERFFHDGGLPALQWSPAYALWYSLLLRLFPDPIATYYVQIGVVGLLTSLLTWCYFRKIGVSRVVSLVGALLWSTQATYVVLRWETGWPRPYHFAFLFVLVGGIVLQSALTLERLSLLTSLLLLAAAVRVEYLISVAIFLPLGALALIRGDRKPSPRCLSSSPPTSRSWIGAVILLLVAVGVILPAIVSPRPLYDSPFFQIDRSWFAFGQKFAAWWLPQTGLVLNPYDDWEVVLGRAFPGAHSIPEAFLVNLRTFLEFESHNVRAFGEVLATAPSGQPYRLEGLGCLLLLTSGALAGLLFRGVRPIWFAASAGRGVAAGYLGAIALAVLPGLVIAPAPVYSLPAFFLLLVLGIVVADGGLQHGLPRPWRLVIQGGLLLVVLAWLIAPSPFDAIPPVRPQLAEVEKLRQNLERERPTGARTTLLVIGGAGYCAYLPEGRCAEVDASWRREGETLGAFLERKQIRAILVTPRLTAGRLFRDDPDFAALVAHPAERGWASVPLSASDTLLLVGRR